MSGARVGSLFSGYGGLERGVQEILGGTAAWHSEIDPGACKILAHRYPDVPNLGDITQVNWSAVEPVDVLTGGFPCTDVSSAGKRAGVRPGTRSGLWSEMARAIDQLRPGLVVIENVRGLLNATAEHPAHSDLEPCPWCVGDDEPVALRALGAVLGDLADIGYDAGWQGLRASDVGAPHGRYRVFVAAWPAADSTGSAWRAAQSEHLGSAPVGAAEPRERSRQDWGPFGHAVRRWERLTRPAPAPTEPGGNAGRARLAPEFVEWMMGLPAGWVTDVPGLPRNEQLKALGNGVCPPQAAAALRMLLPDALEAAA